MPGPAAAAGMGGDPLARWAIGAILAVMALQVLFLLAGCDWDLCGDEAEYWAWSRRLDWSYYTRGPLIAWVIRLGTEVFGGISVAMTGSQMFAARLPAVLLGGLTAWGIFRLAEQTTVSRRAGMFAILLLPAVPVFAIGGVVITSDTPLVCCWTWGAVWALRAIRSDDLRLWALAGVLAALGVLAKYTVLALPASIGLYLLLSPRDRRHLTGPGFWMMTALCVGLGLGPIVAWNASHGWAGAGQLADRLGLSDRSTWGGLWPVLGFLGGEVAVLGGVWWIAGIAELVGALRAVLGKSNLTATDRGRDGTLYLLCLWGVVWCACLAASALGETEANWMAPGYVSLVVLIGGRIGQNFARGGRRAQVNVAAWCVSIAAVVAIHHTDWFYPILARYLPAPTERWAAPLRLVDVTARMRGHQELARAVNRKLESLRAGGASPFVITPTYALTSTLEFYLPGQPETYCLSWNFDMTLEPVNQHDLWHPNPRNDPGPFLGRSLVVVEDANMPPSYSTHLRDKHVVDRIEPIERLEVKEHGVTVGAWDITVCHDYRGIAEYRQNAPYRASDPRSRKVRWPKGARRS
jgi:hypothetical protein